MPTQTFMNLDSSKQEVILKHAIVEFANYPFNEASINRIVKNAKIPKGSLYQYFKDKKDLYLYLIEISSLKKIEYLQNQAQSMDFDDFFEGFYSLMLIGTQFSIAHPQLSQLIKNVDQSVEDDSVALMQKANQDFLKQLIEEAQSKKQLSSDIDIQTIAFILHSVSTNFSSYLNQRYSNDLQTEEIEEAIRAVLKAVQHGIGA